MRRQRTANNDPGAPAKAVDVVRNGVDVRISSPGVRSETEHSIRASIPGS